MAARVVWTDEKIKAIRAGAAAGKTAAEIAIHLGIGADREHLVYRVAYANGIKFRRSGRERPWVLGRIMIAGAHVKALRKGARRRGITPTAHAEAILNCLLGEGAGFIDNLLDDDGA